MFCSQMRRWSAVLSIAVLTLIGSRATAVDFAWDPNNSQLGGGGTWNASLLNWDSGLQAPDSTANVAWTNAATSNAYIGYESVANPGTITLSAGITAGGLNFGTSGYTIATGGNSLTLNAAGTGVATVNFTGVSTLTLKTDGDGSGNPQSVNFLENVTLGTNNGTIKVDRATSAGANKTLQLGDLNLGACQLTVDNPNTYGLEFAGTTTLNGAGTFIVNNATPFTAVCGLTLSGKVTGANASPSTAAARSNSPTTARRRARPTILAARLRSPRASSWFPATPPSGRARTRSR
jgi:hypothetical protein